MASVNASVANVGETSSVKSILTPEEGKERISVLERNKAVLGEIGLDYLTRQIESAARPHNVTQSSEEAMYHQPASDYRDGVPLTGIAARSPQEIQQIIDSSVELLGNKTAAFLTGNDSWKYDAQRTRDSIKAVLDGMGKEIGTDYLATHHFLHISWLERDRGRDFRADLTPEQIRERIELCRATLGTEGMQTFFKKAASNSHNTLAKDGLFDQEDVAAVKLIEKYMGRDEAVRQYSNGWLVGIPTTYIEGIFQVTLRLTGSEQAAMLYLKNHPQVAYALSDGGFDRARGGVDGVLSNIDYLSEKFGRSAVNDLILASGNSRLVAEVMIRMSTVEQDKFKAIADRVAEALSKDADAKEKEKFASLAFDMLAITR